MKQFNKLYIKKLNSYIFIDVENVVYVNSSGYYAEIYTTDNKKHIKRISLSHLISALNSPFHVRINKSTIVNINFVDRITSEGRGDFSITLSNNESFHLGRQYKNQFLSLVGIK